MESISYREIYAKTIINEIKNKIKHNNMIISGDKEKETDKKMLEVILDLQVNNVNNSLEQKGCNLKVLSLSGEEENKRVMNTLSLYYAALYNDNLKLLSELIEEGYSFRGTGYVYDLNLFALDKRISSKFDKELYFKLLKEQSSLFEHFYLTLTYNCEIMLSEDELIEKFSRILNKKPNVALNKKYYCERDRVVSDLLNRYTLTYFDEETILNVPDEQRQTLISYANLARCLTKEEFDRVVNLFKNYGFSTSFAGDVKTILNEFSDEELLIIDKMDRDIFFDYYVKKIDIQGIRDKIEKYRNPNAFKNIVVKNKRKFLSIFKK